MTGGSGEPRVGVAIPAAGGGTRLGGRDKALVELRGEPMLLHSLRPFLEHPAVTSVAVALSPRLAFPPPAWLAALDPRVVIVAGSATRTQSVELALAAIPRDVEVILVHDAARPLVSREVIDRCIEAATAGEGAIAAWPVVDTVKEVDSRNQVIATPDRSRLWSAQTPQAFPAEALREAYRKGVAEGVLATDDAELFQRLGRTVRVVEGSPWNFKVTYADDLVLAELLLDRRKGGGGTGDDGREL